MRRFSFTCLVLATLLQTAPASRAQNMRSAPWWSRDPDYAAIIPNGPALAPTESAATNAPYADGTELSRLSVSLSPRPLPKEMTLSGRDMSDEGTAATLLADRITLSGDRTLSAEGGVVVWYQGARLVADALRYDGASGDMTVTGPIHLTRPARSGSQAEAVVIADEAELSQDLREGLLRGARLVLSREMQMAAREVMLSGGGRLTTLSHVVASSCRVCAEDPTPLWEIRARQITHDAEANILRFEYPQLRAFGLPIAGWPGSITAPDPTVERMSGFLRPRFRTTSGLGFGVMLPYFKTLGDHADLTVTPYLAASETRTLMLRYRQAFWNGATEWNGAISRDDIKSGETRGYLFGAARWQLPRGYQLGLQVQTASDRAYLLDYDITGADRLWSGLTLERVTADKLVWGRIGNYHSLREDEDNITSPTQVADVMWSRHWTVAGGEAGLSWSAHAHRRPSNDDMLGRDMARFSLGLDWRGARILPGGVVASGAAGIGADFYAVRDDSASKPSVTRATPWISASLRYPLTGSDGRASYVLEPVAQLVWSPRDDRHGIPNEDSRQVEFDSGNLFAISRFPGWDAREGGLRANLGLSWSRFDPSGWSLSIAGGRVLRDEADPDFSAESPLAGTRSDWLLAGHYADASGLSIANRALFDDDFTISRDELRIGWARPEMQLSLGYLWMASDTDEDRTRDLSELTAEVGWQVTDGLWASARLRHDFQADRAEMAGLGMTYRNECITVNLAATRRFVSTETVRPDTDIDLSVRLGGFGRQPEGPGTVARRSCMR